MNPTQITLIPLRDAVGADQKTVLDLVIRLTPPELQRTEHPRPSLNIGFVIDRSGSMAERNKITYARQAVCYAIEQLLPSDRLSVTIFDDQVQTLIPSTLVNNKASFIRLVKQVQPGNTTALHQGWVQGGIQVCQDLSAELNRIIVLSDGLANVGETNPDVIASDVQGLAQRGASTSTMGLGDDYNEDLLESMARSGDGNYYYISSAEQLPNIFERELQGLMATIGRNVSLQIQPHGTVVVADVLNDLEQDAQGRLKLRNLTFGNPIDIAVRLQVPSMGHPQASCDICTVQVMWVDAEQQPQSLTATLRLPAVTKAELESIPFNPEVRQVTALMMAARAKQEAIRLVDCGQVAGASQLLQTTRQEILDFNLPMSIPEAAALEDLDQQLQEDQVVYRKMAKMQGYMRGRGRSSGHSSLLYAFNRGPKLGDISQCSVDAIVNSADRQLSANGAVSSAIHHAAGPELLAACLALGECEVGNAKITPGFELPAEWVIHTVCPPWQGGRDQEEQLLAQCYTNCLELAAQHGIQAIAFPAIGTGAMGFPPEVAARVAFTTTAQWLIRHTTIGTVTFICANAHILKHYETEFKRVVVW